VKTENKEVIHWERIASLLAVIGPLAAAIAQSIER
jgi:hypothetical protein